MRPLALLPLLALAACGDKEQSFADGMKHLCGSTASLPSPLSPGEKATAIAEAADRNVTNPEVRELASSLASLQGDARLERLRAAAARAGIERCGLAELWTESPFQKSLRLICEAPDAVRLPPETSQSDRAQALADHIRASATDPKALDLMAELATEDPSRRGARLAEIARENGIARCPLAEMP